MRQIDPRQPNLCSQTTPAIIPPHPENTAGLHTWAEERVEGYSVSLGSLPRTHCESHTPLRPSSQPLPTEYQGQILPLEPSIFALTPSSSCSHAFAPRQVPFRPHSTLPILPGPTQTPSPPQFPQASPTYPVRPGGDAVNASRRTLRRVHQC